MSTFLTSYTVHSLENIDDLIRWQRSSTIVEKFQKVATTDTFAPDREYQQSSTICKRFGASIFSLIRFVFDRQKNVVVAQAIT